MASSVPVSFGDIFKYQSDTGMVIADTSEIRDRVIEGLKFVFQSDDFSTEEGTPNGLLIDAITAMFKDFAGITAQNIGGLNIDNAIGNWLDALGALFGIERTSDDTDYSYRQKIFDSYSRGSGFVQSIYNAIYSLGDAVKNVCVLENGKGELAVRPPNQDNGIAIDPHSVFISVSCDQSYEGRVAEKIRSALSAGCGFHDSNEGTKVEVDNIVFYHPSERFVKIDVTVNPYTYTGGDLQGNVESAVKLLLSTATTCHTYDSNEIIAAIARAGYGIVPTGVKIYIRDSEATAWIEQTDGRLVVMPYQFIDIESVEVNVQ